MESQTVQLKKDKVLLKMSYEYSSFSVLDGNRSIDPSHVKRLVSSMRKKYLIVPIIVNEKMEVIDGQHRLAACEQLELPLYYFMVPGYGLPEVIQLNTNQANWGYNHYLDSFCRQGIFDYEEFRRFKTRYKFGYTDCMTLLIGKELKNSCELFKLGKFRIGNLMRAQEWAKRILSFEAHYPGVRRAPFVRCCFVLFKNPDYDHERMLTKLSYQGGKILDCIAREDYLKTLEKIYNSRVSLEDKVRFF